MDKIINRTPADSQPDMPPAPTVTSDSPGVATDTPLPHTSLPPASPAQGASAAPSSSAEPAVRRGGSAARPSEYPAQPAARPLVPARAGLIGRLRGAVDVVYREMVKFGAVGALAYVVDTYVYNVLRTGVWPITEAPLAHKPLVSKVISVAVATVVAWLGNRYWTFRHRRRATVRAEFVLFVVMNVGGLLIALGCLAFSHYVLGLTSALADNISGNVVGLVLGTLFRFWAYRQLVFTDFRPQVFADAGDAGDDAPQAA